MYYGYGMGYDPMYLLLIVVSTILGMATQGYIKSTYAKWSKVPLDSSLTGADVARRMLADEGVSGVGIEAIGGELTDNYDPRGNVLHLSQGNLRGGSVASAAVACHEAGHAVQHARGYVPVRIRSALVPVVNFTSNAWMIVFFLGIAMGAAGLTRFAIALFAFSVIFQIVTLPVEFVARLPTWSAAALVRRRCAGQRRCSWPRPSRMWPPPSSPCSSCSTTSPRQTAGESADGVDERRHEGSAFGDGCRRGL